LGFKPIAGHHRRTSGAARAGARGFTLIELLAVVVIIGIVAGIAVLSLGALGKDPPAQTTAKRLTALLKMASEDAVMQGRELGLVINSHSYRFLVYDKGQWQALDNDDLFRKRSLDNAVRLDLHLEGRSIVLDNRTDQDDARQSSAAPKPDILFLSSGEVTPFKLRITSTGSRTVYGVSGSLDKGIRMLAPDHE
jgi:general secretion pathway protein H